jgi:hypothetical protein
VIQSQVVWRVSAPIYFQAGRLGQQLQGEHDRLPWLGLSQGGAFCQERASTIIVEKFRRLREF